MNSSISAKGEIGYLAHEYGPLGALSLLVYFREATMVVDPHIPIAGTGLLGDPGMVRFFTAQRRQGGQLYLYHLGLQYMDTYRPTKIVIGWLLNAD
jgi:hypothetical protein